jgi:hypothetical protein
MSRARAGIAVPISLRAAALRTALERALEDPVHLLSIDGGIRIHAPAPVPADVDRWTQVYGVLRTADRWERYAEGVGEQQQVSADWARAARTPTGGWSGGRGRCVRRAASERSRRPGGRCVMRSPISRRRGSTQSGMGSRGTRPRSSDHGLLSLPGQANLMILHVGNMWTPLHPASLRGGGTKRPRAYASPPDPGR